MTANLPKRYGFKLDVLILLYCFATLLLLSLWTAVWFQLGNESRSLRQDEQLKAQALARTFAEHCLHVLRQADHVSHLYQALFENSNGQLPLSKFLNNNSELQRTLSSDVDASIDRFDSAGQLLESSKPLSKTSNVANEDFFVLHSQRASATLLVGKQFQDTKAQTWVVRLSRRLQYQDSGFGGVVSIQLDPLNLVDRYDYQELGPQGSLIVRSNNLAVYRVAQTLGRSQDMQAKPADEEGGVLLHQHFDKIERTYSMRDLPEFGLQVIVGLPKEASQQRYRSYQMMYIGYAAVVSILILLGVVMLSHQTRRLRRSMRAARDAEAILSSAAEGSLDAFYILRCERDMHQRITDFIITNANQRGVRLLGMTRKQIIGKKLCEILPVFRSDGYFDNYVKVVESGAALEEEYEIHIPQIKARWLHHQIVTIGDGVAITVRDITARKQAELETRNNRNFLQSLIDYLPVLVSVTEVSSGRFLVWNKTAEALSGYTAQQVLGKHAEEAFSAEEAARVCARERHMQEHGLAEFRTEEVMTRQDGQQCQLQTVAVSLQDEAGRTEYILCIGEDISLRRAHELQLRKNQAELAAVNDASPLGLVGADRAGLCTYVNRTFEDIAGLRREDALGDGWMQAIYPPDREQILRAFNFLTDSSQAFQGVFRFAHRDGRLVWASVKIAAIRIDGKIEGYVGSVDDITQRREAELALRESEARLRTITNTIPAMIAYIDAQQRYRFHNLSYEREIGIDMRNSDGKTVLEVVGPARYQVILPYIRRVLNGETVVYEDDLSTSQTYRVLECNYIPQFAQDGKTVIGFHVMRQDITAKKLEEQRLLQLAQLDGLTGLSNRAGFMQKLRDAMDNCRERGSFLGLMYMDIDYFKRVNDTYGHHTGDLLLTAFAQRLRHSLRASDAVARLGGDEFTVIMESLLHPEDAQLIADKVVQVMRTPFTLEQQVLEISTSIGVAYYHGEDISAEALINQADMMLYQAKREGRNTWRSTALPVQAG